MEKILHFEELKCYYAGFDGGIEFVHRSRIPSGWIVLIRGEEGTSGFFVPDPHHEWDGNSLP